jgi:hypothetical protein
MIALVADIARTLAKMFVADLGLTLAALAAVGGAWAIHTAQPGVAPWVLTGGILLALIFGVWRGARRL